MDRRTVFWVLYVVLTVGVAAVVAQLLGDRPGTFFIYLGLVMFMSSLPSLLWWRDPVWLWGRRLNPEPAAGLVLTGGVMALAGVVYRITGSVIIAVAVFLGSAALLGVTFEMLWYQPRRERWLRQRAEERRRQELEV